MAQLRNASHSHAHNPGHASSASSTNLNNGMQSSTATSGSASTARAPPVRRNLFHSQLSRRPTTSSTSTSAETLRLDPEASTTATASSVTTAAESSDGMTEVGSSDLVIRDVNGDFLLGDLGVENDDEEEFGEPSPGRGGEDERALADDRLEERQRIADLVKHHQRNRNRAPSEPPGELLEVVRASLRSKVNALAEDNWMYEAEDPDPIR